VTEIYNKGYDLEDFTRYMDTKKENGRLFPWNYRWRRYRHMDNVRIEGCYQHILIRIKWKNQ